MNKNIIFGFILLSFLFVPPLNAFAQTESSNSTSVSSSATDVMSFDPIEQVVVNTNPDTSYQKPNGLTNEGVGFYEVQNIDGTFTLSTHYPFFETTSGEFLPYRLTQNDTMVQVEVSNGKIVVDKNSGAMSLFKSEKLIDSDSYVVRSAISGSDVWNNLSTNDEPITVEVIEQGETLIIKVIRENELGKFNVQHVVFGGKLKTTAFFTNLGMPENSKVAFTQTLNLPDNIITLNDQVIDLNQLVGQSFDRETLENNKDLVIEVQDLFFNTGIGFDNLWSVNIRDSGNDNTGKVSLDYANTEHVMSIGETIGLDPTWNITGTVVGSNVDFNISTLTNAIVTSGDISGTALTGTQITSLQNALNTGVTTWSQPYTAGTIWDVSSLTYSIASGYNTSSNPIRINTGSGSGGSLWTIASGGNGSISTSADQNRNGGSAGGTNIKNPSTGEYFGMNYPRSVDTHSSSTGGSTNWNNAHASQCGYLDPHKIVISGNSVTAYCGTTVARSGGVSSGTTNFQGFIDTWGSNNGYNYWDVTVTGDFAGAAPILNVTYTLAPSIPTDVTPTQDTSSNYNTVDLTWETGSGGSAATSYDVYRGGSNIGTVSTTTTIGAYDVSQAVYSGIAFSGVTSYELDMKPDGTKFYIIEGNNVQEYSLSVPYDLLSGTVTNTNTLNISSYGSDKMSLVIGDSGSKLYLGTNGTDEIYQFTLSTPWDLGSASYSGNSMPCSCLFPGGLEFNGTGDKMFISYVSTIESWTLSTPWDVSTATKTRTDSLSSTVDNRSLFIHPSGTKLWVGDLNPPAFDEYSLGTAYDMTTLSYVQNISMALFPHGVLFNPTGSTMYLSSGWGLQGVQQFDVGVTVVDTDFTDTSAPNSSNLSYTVDGTNSIGTSAQSTAVLIETFYVPNQVVNVTDQGAAVPLIIDWDVATVPSVTNIIDIGWGLTNASYDNISFSVGSQESQPSGLAFKSDGTKFWVVGFSTDTIFQYSLSTPWDLSTTSAFAGGNLAYNVYSQEPTPLELTFSDDGTKMYVVGNSNNTVYQYTLSTPWDFSQGVSYANKSFNVSSYDGSVTSIHFKSDGTKMYIAGDGGSSKVFEFDLSTAWDVSTASYNSVLFNMSSQLSNPSSIHFKSDGTKLFISSQSNTIYQYSLSTAWDVSTASYDNLSFAAQSTTTRGIDMSSDGMKMYSLGTGLDKIYQYSTPNPGNVTTASPQVSQYEIERDDGSGFNTVKTLNGIDANIHTFTSSSNFQITAGSGNVEYLVVGAGAGGGGCSSACYGAGGGGGGDMITGTQSMTIGTFTATVGTGGNGGSAGAQGNDGNSSIFDSITAIAGGGGALGSGSGGNAGNNGANGGGGAGNSGAGGTGTIGNNGGTGAGDNGAGGGGMGSAGSDANIPPTTHAGDGGSGLSSDINGTLTWFSAGGGGGAFGLNNNTLGGIGGSGVGGDGVNSTVLNGNDAVVNSGSGGGGAAGYYGATGTGGDGADGIIIVRYNSSEITATGGTVTTVPNFYAPPVTYSDSTASGSVVYKISASNAVGTGAASANHNAIGGTAPDAPTNLTTTQTVPFIHDLSWTAPSYNGGVSITNYNVYRDGSLLTTLGNVTSYQDNTMQHIAHTHMYEVSAVNSIGEGPKSNQSTITSWDVPAVVTGVIATAQVGSQIQLDWNVPNNGGTAITGYRIQSSIDNITFTDVVATTTTKPYTHTGLTNGVVYYYKISAINSIGEGATGSAQTIVGDIPDTPSSITVVPQAGAQITITIAIPNNNGYSISSYGLQRSSDNFTTFTNLAGQTSNVFVDQNLVIGTGYQYKATATNSLGTTPFSVASVSTLAGDVPSTPTAPGAVVNTT